MSPKSRPLDSPTVFSKYAILIDGRPFTVCLTGEDTLPLTDTTERRPSHVYRRQRRQEGDEEAREGDQGIYERGTRRDEEARPRTESGQGGRGKRRAREDRRDAGTGSRPRRAAPCDYQSQRASPLAQALVRDARLCQGRQGRLLLPTRAQVQDEVRDVRLQRQREPRRRRLVAGRLRAERVDCR